MRSSLTIVLDLYAAQRQFGRVSRTMPDGTVTNPLQGPEEARDPAFDQSGSPYAVKTEARRILKVTVAFQFRGPRSDSRACSTHGARLRPVRAGHERRAVSTGCADPPHGGTSALRS